MLTHKIVGGWGHNVHAMNILVYNMWFLYNNLMLVLDGVLVLTTSTLDGSILDV